MMGKYRKLPFGYKMEAGNVVIHPEEEIWVSYIFTMYASGASYQELTDYMKQEAIPYETDKIWNKNMIARILGDARYQGTSNFPKIINEDLFQRVADLRSTKTVKVQKTEAQKILRRKCGFPLTSHIESEVLYLLNSLTRNPEQIETPRDIKMTADRLDSMKIEMESMLAQFPMDENGTRNKLMQIAVAMYEVVDPREYETYRMRELFRREQPRTELDAILIGKNISTVLVDSRGNVKIKLKNEQIIGRG